ncbi:MAG: hypothetical protein A2233_05045 [Candidatus Kerfeldbacteria bacterium RIFOXYA2_FULL_38_24]|uniref:Polymerase beta nucleotidyltransferase domain-containing protein n=1 Tax=Candidatus Kerfeldbacteria bacterium RIFOXYB2_FULL_38_14 TaxID=1798547 RepID=A0A1G2B993_9BACT|nr:MAG: hypothetical protein A2233_05045 [Candidatus Kerfeldbacteria bacterium RIFOXYA2_FULL_38_24]OGY85692.1 MAG: hypothetical protein A2319_05315 [Candidatus Kerfeldbacteria bacterium RIFOXYB2_FULL_38_14]OGY88378.1 MAG: hypothetical protein A2458_02850 [Candidatus Kerfeldbacteria bacterium RIFOXYC2_FULL_38_9]
MAKKRTIPKKISPYVWGYLGILEKQGVKIDSAYVFGSWAKGTQHKNSDIDVCIISPQFKNWKKKTKLLARAQYDDFFDIEPHGFDKKNFNPKENPVAYEVLKHGIQIK